MALVPSLSDARFAWSPPDSRAARSTAPLRPITWPLRAELPEVDDLNRLTLEATCEVLPLCRDRKVTLLVHLASESMRVRVDSRLVGRAVYDLLEAASGVAQLKGPGYGRLLVSTSRQGDWAEFSVASSRAPLGMLQRLDEVLPHAKDVVEAFGGTLRVLSTADLTTYVAALPLDEPGAPQLEQRVEPFRPALCDDDRAIAGENDEWSRQQQDPDRASQWPATPGALARGWPAGRGNAHL